MCTVSWVHQTDGYHLLCNRDEKRTRGRALPPRIMKREGVHYIAPLDTDAGGTWLAVNERGVSFCLLNGGLGGSGRSRGLIIPELAAATSVYECALRVKQLDLVPHAPFSLVMLEPARSAFLAQWDGRELVLDPAGDAHMPMTSSSYDPDGVRKARLHDFARCVGSSPALDASLLYWFHASHGPAPDAYSTCMHREDAETVSFSWVTVTYNEIRFLYLPGAPCRCHPGEQRILARAA